jgi:hypothetical protein
VVLVHQQKEMDLMGVMQVQVDQAEEQVLVQVFVHNIQYQQEQAFQVKAIQVLHKITHTHNIQEEQGVAVLVEQETLVV